MTQDTRVSTAILDYQVKGDQTTTLASTKIIDGLKQTGVQAQTVAEQLAAMGASIDDVTVGGDKINTSLIEPMDALADATEKAGEQAEITTKKFKDLGNGADLAKFDQLNAGSSGRGVSAQQIGSRIAGLGSIVGGEGSQGFREVSQLVQLGSTIGVVGIVAGVASIAAKGYSDSLAASTERATAFGSALEKAFSGTSADIQGYIRDTQAKIAADTALRDSLKKLADAAPQQLASNLDNASQSFANFLNSTAGDDTLNKPINDASISQEAYNAQVDEYNKKIQLAQIALDAYNAALGTNIVATNNSADMLTNYYEGLAKLELIDAQTQVQAQQMTREERAKKISQDLEEQAVIGALLDQGNLSEAANTSLLDQYATLSAEIQILAPLTNTYADQLKAEEDAKQALSDQTDHYLDSITAEIKTQEELAQTRQNIVNIEAERDTKVLELQQDRDAKLLQDETEAGAKRVEIVSNAADAIAKIERDAGRSEAQAVRERNVDGFLNAREKEQDSLEDQQKSEGKALAAVATNIVKQEAIEKASFQKSADRLYDSTVQKLTIERQAQSRELADLANEKNAEIGLAINGSGGLRQIHAGLWSDLGVIASQGVNNLRNMFSSLFGGTGVPYQETIGSNTPFPTNNAWTNAVQHVVDSRLRSVWE